MMYAWAASVRADEAPALAARFPGLGLVLYPTNYGAAIDLKVPPIAYATTYDNAIELKEMARAGTRFHAVIINDERNANGPSGNYMTPAEYRKQFEHLYRILDGVAPVHTMGLQPIGTWWDELLRRRKFDDAYHAALPKADGRAFNPNKVRLPEVHRVLRMPGPWVLSPAPFRTWWDRMNEPVSVRQWATLAKHQNVRAVALWCLREVHGGTYFGGRWQHEHGLLDRHGNITRVGREVIAHL